jgi:hypothetical protein
VKNTNAVIDEFCPVVISTLCMSFNNKPLVVGIANQFQLILIRRVGFFQLDLNGCGIESVYDSNNLLLLGDHEHERSLGKRPSAGAILI